MSDVGDVVPTTLTPVMSDTVLIRVLEYESHNQDGVIIQVVTDVEAHKQGLLKAKRQERGREDREYQKYGRWVAERLIALGRGHKYRIRKYRRKNSELGWFLAQKDVRAWLRRWHVRPQMVVGLQHTTQVREGHMVRETATIISCAEVFKNGQTKEWKVAVPEKWPRQNVPIPHVLH